MTSFLIGSYNNRIVCVCVGLLRDQDPDDHICGLSLNLIANFCIFIVSFFNIVKLHKSCLFANRSGILCLCLDLCLCWTFVFVCCRLWGVSLWEVNRSIVLDCVIPFSEQVLFFIHICLPLTLI
ncbi:hypothetical protein HanOQP8_Chr03g0122531 [Helianthus annuus]|nr:hypothetical protein HanOQP8_Chr03g0122531 [Helianthus annuus]